MIYEKIKKHKIGGVVYIKKGHGGCVIYYNYYI